MQNLVESWNHWSANYPILDTLLYAAGMILLAVIVNQIVKKILLKGFYHLLNTLTGHNAEDFGVVKRLANIAPALVFTAGIHLVPHLPDHVVAIVRNVTTGFMILTLAMSLCAGLDLLNYLYMTKKAEHSKPIKGYFQVIKIIIYAIATLLIIATLIDRSPLILFSGLGAMAAVLMLIFQDTLLSLVASVQISSGDLVRVGDWVEIPALGVDGDITDMALHTVKIRNFDKTITTVPTKRFITEAVKNWRGMQESGGRRIKRSLLLDQQSIRFLTNEEIEDLKKFRLMEGYFESKIDELNQWNEEHIHARTGETSDTRRLTNIGTFRAYIVRYLKNHPGVNPDMLLIVRQLQPTSEGLPLEVYCFTSTTAWVPYEGIQSDIFDHLLAIAPEFGLRVYQAPSGGDFAGLAGITKPA